MAPLHRRSTAPAPVIAAVVLAVVAVVLIAILLIHSVSVGNAAHLLGLATNALVIARSINVLRTRKATAQAPGYY